PYDDVGCLSLEATTESCNPIDNRFPPRVSPWNASVSPLPMPGEHRRQKILQAAAATGPEVLRFGRSSLGDILWPTRNSAAIARSANRRKRSQSPDRTFRPTPARSSRARLARRVAVKMWLQQR